MISFYSNGRGKERGKEELVLKGVLFSNLTTAAAILAGEIVQAHDAQAT